MSEFNHDTDCIVTKHYNGARVWMHSDEETIIVETWNAQKEMHQEVINYGEPGYFYHLERLGIEPDYDRLDREARAAGADREENFYVC